MMRATTSWIRFGSAAAAIACAAVGWGQDSRPVGFSLRLGQFAPQGRDARAEGEQWFTVGIDVKLMELSRKADERNYVSLSVDFADRGRFQTVPVQVNWVSRTRSWYYFVGAGAAYTTVPKPVGPDIEEDESVQFAYQIGFGYDFERQRSPLFLEAKYMGNRQDKLNGFVVSVGVRL